MDEQEIIGLKAVYVTVKAVCERLSDDELIGLNLTLALGNDPRNLSYYDKASLMFQEEYDPPVMHNLVKRAFNIFFEARIV
jgi:hypothetical protein